MVGGARGTKYLGEERTEHPHERRKEAILIWRKMGMVKRTARRSEDRIFTRNRGGLGAELEKKRSYTETPGRRRSIKMRKARGKMVRFHEKEGRVVLRNAYGAAIVELIAQSQVGDKIEKRSGTLKKGTDTRKKKEISSIVKAGAGRLALSVA